MKTTLPPAAARELLRRVVERALASDELSFFAEAAHRSGFVDLLAEHIRELKRRDILPADYAKARPPRGDAQQLRELALLYAEYERQLTAHDLCDSESVHWAARDALAAGDCQRFQDLALVVVDGFTDFTRMQHEILRLLAQRTEQMLISLPVDATEIAPPTRLAATRSDSGAERAPGTRSAPVAATSASRLNESPRRADLFAKVTATLAELRRQYPQLEIEQLAARPSSWPALDHVAQHIFSRPGQVPPPTAAALASLDRLEIVEAAGAQDEIVQIARRIKRRLSSPLPVREGLGEGSSTSHPSPNLSPQGRAATRPGDIVVVFRTLTEVAPRIREVFEQFGIPFWLESRLPLATAAVLKTLLALLRLDDNDWPFGRVVSLVTNNTLTALDSESRQAADWLVRDLQIAHGREELLRRVKQLATDQAADRGDRAEHRARMAQLAQPALIQLAQALDILPMEATPNAWCAALAQAGAALGLLPFDEIDLVAWQSIIAHFAALERLDGWLGEPPRKLSRRDLLRSLTDFARNESLPPSHDDVGRVRVLDAPSARTVCAKHLFLAGMSEQAFPLPERAGRLATDADYRFIARAADQELAATPGIAASRAQEEMLLFYEVLSRAEESLTISYPALDDKAQALPASPYVTEIERVLGEENSGRLRRSVPQLTPVPQEAIPYSFADWRVQAIAKALGGDRQLLGGIFACHEIKPLANVIDAGVRLVHARARGDAFGPAEGLLTSPAALERLAQRFGPQHLWSPSQWETYATCPFRFFMEDVLRLEPLGELVLETDFARRGSRLHQVLATFHRQWPGIRGGLPLTADEEAAQFLEYLHTVIDERIAAAPRDGIDAALLELDRRQIRRWTEGYFAHHAKYDGACSERGVQLTPAHFEFRFGPPRSADENDPNSVDNAFLLDIDGEQIRITGQIDRIDIGAIDGRTVFNVIDYKSGKKMTLKLENIESGEKLQLPIYVEAAQALLFSGDATPMMAGYWSMAGGFDAKGALAVVQEGDEERWQNVQATTHRLIRQFVRAIRNGEFPVASRDDKCTSYCDFNTVCRIAQVRSLGKTWPPDAACGLAQDKT